VLKDRRIGLGVDRDHDFGAFNSHRMVGSAAYPNRDVQLRINSLAGQADLQLPRHPSLVRNATSRAHSCAELSREVLSRGDALGTAHAHADTDHNQKDTRTGSVEDCASQRNLTDRGRDHARAIGEAIRALEIPIGVVVASPLCRTVETATLAFGAAERSQAAREAGPAPPGSPDRFAALRGLLSTMPASGTNAVIRLRNSP